MFGNSGHTGASNSSSSSIHSGYKSSQVTVLVTESRCRAICSASGIISFHWLISVALKFSRPTPLYSFVSGRFRIIPEIWFQLTFEWDK
ncbi:hypothetical protein HanPSC8_Chr05g0227411 [Helianthus annuus]|nr:hypothetical protein HanIR_Chr05g0253151 [Helianthus annuus]KAJ0924370.1 hypothetical protein HanPSC8_Chr05g0227411 [Helianthus annuus]